MPLPFTAVPIVLTPFAVMLVGAALGSRLGFVTQVLYLAAGAAGLPVFAPSLVLPPGAARLIGPTGGYLLAYPVAAFVTGWLAERGWDRRYITSLAQHACRTRDHLHRRRVLAVDACRARRSRPPSPPDSWPHIGLDLIKAAVAAKVLPLAWKVYFPNTSKY